MIELFCLKILSCPGKMKKTDYLDRTYECFVPLDTIRKRSERELVGLCEWQLELLNA